MKLKKTLIFDFLTLKLDVAVHSVSTLSFPIMSRLQNMSKWLGGFDEFKNSLIMKPADNVVVSSTKLNQLERS